MKNIAIGTISFPYTPPPAFQKHSNDTAELLKLIDFFINFDHQSY